MLLRYGSGEEIEAGDFVLYQGEPGQIEFVAKAGDPETGWYVEQFGGGCMIITSSLGRVFVSEPGEDLEFVSRAQT